MTKNVQEVVNRMRALTKEEKDELLDYFFNGFERAKQKQKIDCLRLVADKRGASKEDYEAIDGYEKEVTEKLGGGKL